MRLRSLSNAPKPKGLGVVFYVLIGTGKNAAEHIDCKMLLVISYITGERFFPGFGGRGTMVCMEGIICNGPDRSERLLSFTGEKGSYGESTCGG